MALGFETKEIDVVEYRDLARCLAGEPRKLIGGLVLPFLLDLQEASLMEWAKVPALFQAAKADFDDFDVRGEVGLSKKRFEKQKSGVLCVAHSFGDGFHFIYRSHHISWANNP